MSDTQLYNDRVYAYPLVAMQNGATVAFPAGLSAASSLPNSLGAAIGGTESAPILYLTPKVQASVGITVTVTGASMAPLVEVYDIVADPNLVSIALGSGAPTTSAQNVPTAPGP